jgi:para-aminobenzoate synthetase component 1
MVFWGAPERFPEAPYSLVLAEPMMVMQSWGSWCRLESRGKVTEVVGSPWRVLADWWGPCRLPEMLEPPWPAGGVFGFWGYDLKHHLEPRVPRRGLVDTTVPDLWLGFYSSLLVHDHRANAWWLVATGLGPDGSRSVRRAARERGRWHRRLDATGGRLRSSPEETLREGDRSVAERGAAPTKPVIDVRSSLSREAYLAAVRSAQDYIRAGDIYQVNLARRLEVDRVMSAEVLFHRLRQASPAPFAAYLDAGEFQICSSSPELFLRMTGPQLVTRPIKGTRPRSNDPARDATLAAALLESAKERAELVMITDLLRNDLGRVCEYGSVQAPELARLERFAQVQHLVSTVTGRLRPGLTHLDALAACFPGGSVTGAPKVRAMELIETLEPVGRGPYTGCLGYLGFNDCSQLSIIIRSAVVTAGGIQFHTGAGIVADSEPAAEYEETEAKARGFRAALAPGEDLA